MPMINTVLSNKHNSVCAFCRYWYDPANSYIKPQKFPLNSNKSSRALCCFYYFIKIKLKLPKSIDICTYNMVK